MHSKMPSAKGGHFVSASVCWMNIAMLNKTPQFMAWWCDVPDIIWYGSACHSDQEFISKDRGQIHSLPEQTVFPVTDIVNIR